MVYSAETVAVVVDPACGDRLGELVSRMPVWVADTRENAAAITRVRHSLRGTGSGSLTSFVVDPGAAPEDWLGSVLDSVDLHHGGYSQDPPYRKIEVHGARLSQSLRGLLDEYGLTIHQEEPFGFSASRPA
jgi:hypothetical protein